MNTQLYLRVNGGNVGCYKEPNLNSRIETVFPIGTSLLVESIHNQDNDPSADRYYACVQYFDAKSQRITFGYISLQSTHLIIAPIKYDSEGNYVF